VNARRILLFGCGPVGGAILGFAVILIVASAYDVPDVGRLAIAQVLSTLGAGVLTLGMDQSLAREFHEVSDQPALLRATFLPGISLLAPLLGALLIWPAVAAEQLYNSSAARDGVLTALLIAAAYINRFLLLMLRLRELAGWFSVSVLLQRSVQLVLISVFALQGSGDFSELLGALVVSMIINLCVLCVANFGMLMLALRARVRPGHVRLLLRYGLPLMFASLALWGVASIDRFMLREFSTLDQLAVYGLSGTIASAALLAQGIFTTVWVPTVVRWIASGTAEARIPRVRELVTAAFVLLMGLVGCLSWTVTAVLPGEYSLARRLIVAATIGPLMLAIGETTMVGINVVRRTVWAVVAAAIACAASIVLNLALVPKFGAVGAGTAAVAAYLVLFILRTEFASRVWVRLGRMRSYGPTFGCSGLTMATLWVHDRLLPFVEALWLIAGVLGAAWLLAVSRTWRVAAPGGG